ncbi:hypothetical protein KAI54_02710 [Candidatus Gracilibacteria bacterium]|nr:hypothetical protein [Candidatus Gracilibacteria bacterium]
MKKLSILLAVAFTLLGCQQVQPEKVIDGVPTIEETTLVRSPVFGISVDSIANGATVSGVPIVISGSVSTIANSVSVNGYQLQNYEKDGGMWNYTLDPKFGNLTVGENIYEIKADGSDGISATTTLVINFEPAR